MHKLILLLIGLMVVSCTPAGREVQNKEAKMICDDIYAKGQFKYGHYVFCALVPVDQEYSYKSGFWEYWNFQRRLVAAGTYKLEKVLIEGEGECSYEIIESKIQKEKWKFWDEKGNQIQGTEKLIKKFELICNDYKYINN